MRRREGGRGGRDRKRKEWKEGGREAEGEGETHTIVLPH